MRPPRLAPSIMTADFARLGEQVRDACAAGVDRIHLDIMDGHFVPNLTWGPQTLADLRPGSKLFFDTHLMLSRPDKYVDAFAKSGAQLITVHVEPEYDIRGTLKRIRELGCGVGIAFNPDIPAERVEPYLGEVDLVLAMTVFPGFGGQAFMPAVLPKLEQLVAWRRERGLNYRIEVDGGVDASTGLLCRKAGADTLVAGSAFFKAPDKIAFRDALTR